MSKTLLITGGCGFVGHHMVDLLRGRRDVSKVIIFDKLNYSGSLDRLRDIHAYPDDRNIQVLTVDLSLPISENVFKEVKDVTHIIHMAAESHVDKSISDPASFVTANVLGTAHMLDLARKLTSLDVFYYFSTDETYGPAPMDSDFKYSESDADNPGNPYAATKAGGDMLVKAYSNTFGIKCITTRTMNVIGERQHAEKFIPLCIKKIRSGDTVTIHGTADGKQAGKRTYIHACNVAKAYDFLLNQGSDIFTSTPPDFYKNYRNYNIVGEKEMSNLEVASMISEILQEPLIHEIVDFHSSRPGHDLRYAMSGDKLANLGWTPPQTLYQSLKQTVQWYLDNPEWLNG